jgi:hypothetical protein
VKRSGAGRFIARERGAFDPGRYPPAPPTPPAALGSFPEPSGVRVSRLRLSGNNRPFLRVTAGIGDGGPVAVTE